MKALISPPGRDVKLKSLLPKQLQGGASQTPYLALSFTWPSALPGPRPYLTLSWSVASPSGMLGGGARSPGVLVFGDGDVRVGQMLGAEGLPPDGVRPFGVTVGLTYLERKAGSQWTHFPR